MFSLRKDIETTTDPISVICSSTDFKYNPIELADKLLEHYPDNKDTLYYKYYLLDKWIGYSIH